MDSVDQLREQIIEVGRRMYQRGMCGSNDGNISIRLAENRFLSTCTNVSKGFLKPEHIIIMNDKAELVEGDYAPTSESAMHIHIYQRRPEVQSVVHAHPVYATGFATAGISLETCVLPEIAATIGTIPLTEYATPTTDEVPRAIDWALDHTDAFLLANHGAVTVGADVFDAYYKLERVEHYAHIIFIARMLGGEKPLTHPQAQKLLDLFGMPGPAGNVRSCVPGVGAEESPPRATPPPPMPPESEPVSVSSFKPPDEQPQRTDGVEEEVQRVLRQL